MNITIELSEHDARRLLELLKHQAQQDEPLWRPYWQTLAGHFSGQIERFYTVWGKQDSRTRL